MWLVGLQNVFSHQLPRMPKEYITRLVFDPCVAGGCGGAGVGGSPHPRPCCLQEAQDPGTDQGRTSDRGHLLPHVPYPRLHGDCLLRCHLQRASEGESREEAHMCAPQSLAWAGCSLCSWCRAASAPWAVRRAQHWPAPSSGSCSRTSSNCHFHGWEGLFIPAGAAWESLSHGTSPRAMGRT